MTTRPRAAIYARISSDREGAGLGVARQVKDCRALCEREGFDVVAVFEDNDLSAWSGKARPGYDQMWARVNAGEIDVVAVWHTDRLTRSPRDLEDIIDTCQLRDVTIHAVTAGVLDLSTAHGQLQARVAAAFARHESDQKATRVRRKHQELAEMGRPASLGGSYGYNQDGTVNNEQAAVIRDLAARLLAGESLRSLTMWLTETGVLTAKGGTTWSTSTVRQILTAGRLCGWREWTPRTPTGEDKKGWKGTPRRGYGMGRLVAKGDWEPILTRAQTEAIRLLVSDPNRSTTTRRHYLLSAGILKCGLCGKSMNHKVEVTRNRIALRDENGEVVKDERGRTVRVVKQDGPVRKNSRYACIKQSGRGCGGISISCPDLDAFVTEAIFEALDGADLGTDRSPAESDVAVIRQRIADLEAKQIQIGVDYAEGLIGRAEWLAMKERIEQHVDAARSELPAEEGGSVLAHLPTGVGELRSAWPSMPLDRQRAIVQAVAARVTVNRAPRPPRTRGFDPARIQILWRA